MTHFITYTQGHPDPATMIQVHDTTSSVFLFFDIL
jgi:hypothetical protein